MDEFWANLDYTIYSGNTKLTATEICRRYELKKLQQQQSIKDQSQSVVIDLEPSNRPKSPALFAQPSAGNDDKMDYNIVIKTEEKTVNENLDTVDRTKFNSTNAIINKHFDFKRNDSVNTATTTSDTITNRINGTVNILNTDNNNNSGNNSSNSSKNNNTSSNNASNRLSNINNMFRLPSNASGDAPRQFTSAHSSSSPFGSSSSSVVDNVGDATESTSTQFQQNSSHFSSKV